MYMKRFKCQGNNAIQQNFNTAMLDYIKFGLFRYIPIFLQDTKYSTQKFSTVIRRLHIKSFSSYYVNSKIFDMILPISKAHYLTSIEAMKHGHLNQLAVKTIFFWLNNISYS